MASRKIHVRYREYTFDIDYDSDDSFEAEEEALMLQEAAVNGDNGEFEREIRPYISQVPMYEDPMLQEAARETVPVEELKEKALDSLAKDGNFKPIQTERGHAFLLQLLFWFKQSFSMRTQCARMQRGIQFWWKTLRRKH